MHRFGYVLLAAAVAQVAGFAMAQTTAPSADAGVPSAGENKANGQQDKASYSASAGANYQFETDLDNADSFSLARFGAGVGVHYPLSNTQFSFDHSLVYERDDYNFDGLSIGGQNLTPWDDTNLVSYSLQVNYRANRDWAVFAGPILGFAAEDGADWGDAFTYGASAGVRYQASKDFAIGLGVIGIQEIENNASVLPLVLVNWKITDDLRLGNARPQPGLRGGAGIELAWAFAPKWEAAIGGAYDRRRFRLNDDAHAMAVNSSMAMVGARDGVGENTSFPIYARLSYHPDSHWSITALGGALLAGELRLEDSDGDKLASEDYDTAPFVGLAVSWRM
jgi:hypothetical protein